MNGVVITAKIVRVLSRLTRHNLGKKMPIYVYGCRCGKRVEIVQRIGDVSPACADCGESMTKMPTFPAMVKMAGIYSTPAERKFNEGTAPFSNEKGSIEPFREGDPDEPPAEKQGRKWLAHGKFAGIKRDPEATYGKTRKEILAGIHS